MSRYFSAEIIRNQPLKKNHNLLILSFQKTAKTPIPGQFYMIKTANAYDPLLMRPFSLFRRVSKEVQFLYRIKGKGTERMQQMEKGGTVRLLGPLGNGYPPAFKNLTPLVIAGGVGIASLFPLLEKLGGKAYLFYGGRTKGDLLLLSRLREMAKELFVSTDDGSAGEKGTVVDLLDKFLNDCTLPLNKYVIYACGPSPMLRVVSRVATEKGIKGFVSMEENMACGVGACQGCTVKTVRGYKRVCMEGPVFQIGEIVW